MSDRLQIPDMPQDVPYNLREWVEAVQSILLVITDAHNKRDGTQFVTVDEMIDAGVTNADKLKE